MTWRATKNALAGLLAGLAGCLLLGGLLLIGGAALVSLVQGPGGWEHAAIYVAVDVLVFVLVPWVVQGLALLQRSRIRATLGTEIPAPARASGAASWLAGPWLDVTTWRQLGYHVLAVATGICGAALAFLFPVWPWLARQVTRTDERLARVLLGPGSRRGAGAAGRVAGPQPRRPGRRGRRRTPPDRARPARRRAAAAGLAGHEPRHGPGASRRRIGTRPPGPRRRARRVRAGPDRAAPVHPRPAPGRAQRPGPGTRRCPGWPPAPRCRSGCRWTCRGRPRPRSRR